MGSPKPQESPSCPKAHEHEYEKPVCFGQSFDGPSTVLPNLRQRANQERSQAGSSFHSSRAQRNGRPEGQSPSCPESSAGSTCRTGSGPRAFPSNPTNANLNRPSISLRTANRAAPFRLSVSASRSGGRASVRARRVGSIEPPVAGFPPVRSLRQSLWSPPEPPVVRTDTLGLPSEKDRIARELQSIQAALDEMNRDDDELSDPLPTEPVVPPTPPPAPLAPVITSGGGLGVTSSPRLPSFIPRVSIGLRS